MTATTSCANTESLPFFDEEDRRDVSKTNAELEMEWLWQFVQKCSAFSVDASKWLESVFSLQ